MSTQKPHLHRATAPLAHRLERLEASAEELTRLWLMQVVEESSLAEIERLPTGRVARELPALVAEVVAELGGGDGEPCAETPSAFERLAGFRSAGPLAPGRVVRDIAALHAVLAAALVTELAPADPETLSAVLVRLSVLVGAAQAGAVEQLVGERVRELEHLATTDGLTGLHNFRHFRRQLDHLLGIHERYGHPFALLLLDVDDLKAVNDAHGHAAGDHALKEVAAALRRTVRAVDTAARTGGDEFCVLAPNQGPAWGAVLAERLSARVASVPVAGDRRLGVSIGVVGCPDHGLGAEELLEAADAAMYRAKGARQANSAAGEAGKAIALDLAKSS